MPPPFYPSCSVGVVTKWILVLKTMGCDISAFLFTIEMGQSWSSLYCLLYCVWPIFCLHHYLYYWQFYWSFFIYYRSICHIINIFCLSLETMKRKCSVSFNWMQFPFLYPLSFYPSCVFWFLKLCALLILDGNICCLFVYYSNGTILNLFIAFIIACCRFFVCITIGVYRWTFF